MWIDCSNNQNTDQVWKHAKQLRLVPLHNLILLSYLIMEIPISQCIQQREATWIARGYSIRDAFSRKLLSVYIRLRENKLVSSICLSKFNFISDTK